AAAVLRDLQLEEWLVYQPCANHHRKLEGFGRKRVDCTRRWRSRAGDAVGISASQSISLRNFTEMLHGPLAVRLGACGYKLHFYSPDSLALVSTGQLNWNRSAIVRPAFAPLRRAMCPWRSLLCVTVSVATTPAS